MRWRRLPLRIPAGRADAAGGNRSELRSQHRLGKRVELLDRGARDAEDLTATAPEGDPGFECSDAFGAQTLDQRQGQFSG